MGRAEMPRTRTPSSWPWGVLAAAALLWPDRISGPFDGIPLDGAAEAVCVGVVFPALCWLHPRFLTTRLAKLCIVGLLGWRALAGVALVRDGWCVRLAPSTPYVKDQTGAPHSWDLRADWRSPNPSCTAIMTHAYAALNDFPAWFFNLPPPNDSWPGERDRPPGATTGMTVTGFLDARRTGVFEVVTGPDVAATLSVDDAVVSRDGGGREGVTLSPGTHRILIDATLTGNRWQLSPLWNGADLWPGAVATLGRPSVLDRAVRPWARWMATVLVVILGVAWVSATVGRLGNADVLAWTIGAAACVGLLGATGNGSLGRAAIPMLLGAAWLPVPARLRNSTGVFALVGVPWLTLVIVTSAPSIGRFTLYDWGNDYWMFQRFAYRIFMQGYWLEGGSPTFWFQPLYRWIAGALHLVFGDSSVGEAYWDGALMLAGALFAFRTTKSVTGFRWGLTAAVATLTIFTLGTTWVFHGRGLSEISSAGLLYLAAFAAMRSRRRGWAAGAAAGLLATAAFYTRLNNLPMACAVALFALPLTAQAGTARRPSAWRPRLSWPTAVAVLLALGLGLVLFAARTWYYTGVFSVFYGTQRDLLAVWQPGMSLATGLRRTAGSVMMVLTMNDPPRFDPYAVPLLAGASIAVLAAAGVPRLRQLPLGLVFFCLAGLAGSLVTRGTAYSGRFSIHMIAVTSAIVACTAALWAPGGRLRRRSRSPADTPRAR
jgi:hypothetical protein